MITRRSPAIFGDKGSETINMTGRVFLVPKLRSVVRQHSAPINARSVLIRVDRMPKQLLLSTPLDRGPDRGLTTPWQYKLRN